jgi:phosphoglycolate phosphatase-like HAD superfamily hydrolase
MSNVYIFDFDGTIADTTKLQPYRDTKNWELCYQHLDETFIYDGIREMLARININNDKSIITSHCISFLVEKILAHHNLSFSEVFGFHSFKGKLKPHPYLLQQIKEKYDGYTFFGIGDESIDGMFYQNCQIESICAGWNPLSNTSFAWDRIAQTPNDIFQ